MIRRYFATDFFLLDNSLTAKSRVLIIQSQLVPEISPSMRNPQWGASSYMLVYAPERFFVFCNINLGTLAKVVILRAELIYLARCLLRSLSKCDSRSEINSRISCLCIAFRKDEKSVPTLIRRGLRRSRIQAFRCTNIFSNDRTAAAGDCSAEKK